MAWGDGVVVVLAVVVVWWCTVVLLDGFCVVHQTMTIYPCPQTLRQK